MTDLDLSNPGLSLLLFSVALMAGVVNGVAGGGGLLLFPTLILTGMPPVQANATNTASLWVGTVASTIAYREELISLRRELPLLTFTSVVGGILGAYLLLQTPTTTFTALIPYLMLTATLTFAFGKPAIQWLRTRNSQQAHYQLPITIALPLQFAIAVYIGFFGGGAGIVILALLDLMGLKNVHTMNAAKTWLATCTNGIAMLTFILAHAVLWSQALLMSVGASIGGYASAYFARQLHPAWVRGSVISIGCVITAYFFVK